MQDNNQHKNDAFSESVKQKFENHQLPVDADLWGQIEKQMQQKARHKIAWWLWVPIGSAALLALLFTNRSFNETPTFTKNSEGKNIHLFEKTTNQTVAHKVIDSKKIERIYTVKAAINKQVTFKNTYLSAQAELTNNQIAAKDSSDNKNTLKVTNSDNHPENETIAEVMNINKDSIPSNETNKLLPENLPDNQLVVQKNDRASQPKAKKNWLLAAAFGSGSSGKIGSIFGNPDMLTANGDKGLVTANAAYTNILTPNDFSNIVHLPPVSFGLIVRKNLDKVWSVESGLVYTYLLSTFDNQGMQRRDAKLHLHYVGVPLNFVAQLWNNPKWEIYISVGGTIEKGLRSIYIQNQYFGNQTYTTTAETKIDGFQYSLNTSFGTTYKLQRNLGIYFEPKIFYYFNNNQPMSARTQQPFTVGLNVGLRYEL